MPDRVRFNATVRRVRTSEFWLGAFSAMALAASACAGRGAAPSGTGAATAAAAPPDLLTLDIGPAGKRGTLHEVVLDAVLETASGQILTPAEAIDRLAKRRVILVGESHTSLEAHEIQRRIVAGLGARGRRGVIGLEMLPHDVAVTKPLGAWGKGALSDEAFLRAIGWYRHWGYNFGYYRPLFAAAAEAGFSMAGVNVPREVITAVREKGFAGLDQTNKQHLPFEVDVEDQEHERFFRAHFSPEDQNHMGKMPGGFEGLFRAQCTWDAAMAHHGARAFERLGGAKAGALVILAGSGHVAYGLGIARQGQSVFPEPAVTVIPVAVSPGEPVQVVASYADYVWGIPPEAEDSPFPSLGASLKDQDGAVKVGFMSQEGAAGRAGVQMGDIIENVDGQKVSSKEEVLMAVAALSWGDALELGLRRPPAETQTVRVLFRRQLEGAP